MKIDFRKTVASYKARQHQFTVVDVPSMRYLMIDGEHGLVSVVDGSQDD